MNIYKQVDPFIDYSKIKLVIFDVDGTLYNQKKLRIFMIFKIIIFILFNPRKINEIRIIKEFREQRELRSFEQVPNINSAQYEWVAEEHNLDPLIVKQIVEEWILNKPLKYLKKCRKKGVRTLFNKLKENKIKIAIFSEYPSKSKLEILGLKADLIISSTDSFINKFKPDPKGINYIINKFKINKLENCLFIGDRIDKDLVCANNASVKCLIVK